MNAIGIRSAGVKQTEAVAGVSGAVVGAGSVKTSGVGLRDGATSGVFAGGLGGIAVSVRGAVTVVTAVCSARQEVMTRQVEIIRMRKTAHFSMASLTPFQLSSQTLR